MGGKLGGLWEVKWRFMGGKVGVCRMRVRFYEGGWGL